jgi:hypothetical protein
MATKTLCSIRDSIADRVSSLERLADQDGVGRAALRLEIAELRALATRVQITIDRMKDTWG